MDTRISRRDAVARLGGFVALAALRPAGLLSAHKPFNHPDPRPGITAANVLPLEKVAYKKSARAAYDAARQFPGIFDGLYCVCDCEKSMGHRSLLSCFESDQAIGCGSCREQAILAARLAKAGQTLEQIRAAFDKRWG